MRELTVVKRDGTHESFKQEKVDSVVDWACSSLSIDPTPLKEKLSRFLSDGITTEAIQKLLINNAVGMVSIEEPEWKYVAARLILLNLYKSAKATQGYNHFGYGDYAAFVKKATKEGVYSPLLLEKYTEDELRTAATWLDYEYDLGYDYAGLYLLANRYLRKLKGTTFELPQQMYLTLALLLASVEDSSTKMDTAEKFYHAIADRKISPATPILLNLRRNAGSLASCFIMQPDDSLDSLYYIFDQAAQISKNAGGVGINFSRVRSNGAEIKGIPDASNGVNPWIKIINDTSVAVDQLGSRSGAITVALDLWHRDIENFLELQTENGDQRKKSFDIFPQISVPDLFLKRYQLAQIDDTVTWTTFDPHEVRQKHGIELADLWGEEFEKAYEMLEADATMKYTSKLDPRKLMKHILRTGVETGLPYWFFKDTVNRMNPNRHVGVIPSANLCVESFSPVAPSLLKERTLQKIRVHDSDQEIEVIRRDVDPGYIHTCNLVSQNLSRIKDGEEEFYTTLSVRMLDNTIELTKLPVLESQRHNEDFRILGVGAFGLADRLVQEKIMYTQSAEYVNKLFEKIGYFAIKASSELAKDRGSYKHFNGSDWSRGVFFGKSVNELTEETTKSGNNLDWKGLAEAVRNQGIRNGGLLAIAPNTSTSLLHGCSASVLPVYSKFLIDENSNGFFPVVAQFLSNDTFWLYQEHKNVDQKKVVDVVSTIQKWTDQGISMELLLNPALGLRAPDIKDLYMHAWKRGSKTVYYLRSQKKQSECESCAN